jgi:hypothetical protein
MPFGSSSLGKKVGTLIKALKVERKDRRARNNRDAAIQNTQQGFDGPNERAQAEARSQQRRLGR